jgi:hypothetical protein
MIIVSGARPLFNPVLVRIGSIEFYASDCTELDLGHLRIGASSGATDDRVVESLIL